MSTTAAFLFLVGVFAGAMLLLRRAERKRRSAAQATAARLGLEMTYVGALGKTAAAPAPFGGGWELSGRWNGRDVRVDGLPGRREFKAVRAPFRAPLALGISVGGRAAAFRFHPSGSTRVTTGNAEFDAAVEVRARDAAGAEALVRRPGVQRAWLDAIAADGSASADDAGVFVARDVDALGDPTAVSAALDAITRLAETLERAMADFPGRGRGPSPPDRSDLGALGE